ncbi:hypothetical protein ANCDUO_07340 [Ancylostoma duodenale]|uniref:PDZ domain-containing protein n=1 Tax=Ancylostoma duodenale TaxID=51022 RepID=A0A0C2CZB9_9BILA|nr:hypothetical protein ANCDUO_07340 [Ancylostoma duodenale]
MNRCHLYGDLVHRKILTSRRNRCYYGFFRNGLLPGDQLVKIDGRNVDAMSREELQNAVRNAGNQIALEVKSVPELAEFCDRKNRQSGARDDGDQLMLGHINTNLHEGFERFFLRNFRHGCNLLYTNAGLTSIVCVASAEEGAIGQDRLVSLFKGCRRGQMPAHVYATAQQVYR